MNDFPENYLNKIEAHYMDRIDVQSCAETLVRVAGKDGIELGVDRFLNLCTSITLVDCNVQESTDQLVHGAIEHPGIEIQQMADIFVYFAARGMDCRAMMQMCVDVLFGTFPF